MLSLTHLPPSLSLFLFLSVRLSHSLSTCARALKGLFRALRQRHAASLSSHEVGGLFFAGKLYSLRYEPNTANDIIHINSINTFFNMVLESSAECVMTQLLTCIFIDV